jgi:hypothetical protein
VTFHDVTNELQALFAVRHLQVGQNNLRTMTRDIAQHRCRIVARRNDFDARLRSQTTAQSLEHDWVIVDNDH